MANNLLANPMQISGSMASSYKTATASALGTLRTLKVEKLEWLSPGTVGDTIVIGDPISGLELANFVCETALQSQLLDWTANPKLWQDFEINSFPSGTLKIWTRSE
jgi:hypothetical protein